MSSLLALGAVVLAACSPTRVETPPGDTDIDDPPPTGVVPIWDPETPPVAVLEIYAMDIWAQPLPPAGATVSVMHNGQPVEHEGFPIVTVPLYDPGNYLITLDAPDHEPAELSLTFDGSDDLKGMAVGGSVSPLHGKSLSHDQRMVDDTSLPIHTAYIGLAHQWFSSQARPARRGNTVDLLLDGEEAWERVHQDLITSDEGVMMSTWWWESRFELVRDWDDHHLLDAGTRSQNTVLNVVDARPGTHRVLVGEFWGSNTLLDGLTTDSLLESRALVGGDDFEVLGQGNPTFGTFFFEPSAFYYADRVRNGHAQTADRNFDVEDAVASTIASRTVDLTWWPISLEIQIASYHQKFMVIDQDVAFVGGMNTKGTDWDSAAHLVWDHRRMAFDATPFERQQVIAKEELPDFGPRKDFMARVEGPAVQDVAEVFHDRWAYQIAQNATLSENASDFTVLRDQPEVGTSQVQVTTTMPQPFWEHGIAESWLNAVAHAEDFIFIEDQYWRVPMLTDAIIERMQQVPDLKLMVVTKPVDEWLDPGCAWTHLTHQQLLTQFPGRYATYQLKTFDTRLDDAWPFDEDETEAAFVNIDIHSKLLIVDDKFLSVGSANKNNRGIVYEGEMNLAVFDPAWVTAQRRRVIADMLPPGTAGTDDSNQWWTQFENAAAWNESVLTNWDIEEGYIDLGSDTNPGPLPMNYTPEGFVHPLEFRTLADCLFEDVGPDMM